jgi:hypothetical protein
MRKQFLIPVLVGILALGAAQAFAQSATVVMRNGDRVRAEVIDMGRNFTLNVNGQTREVPIGDIVLLDFAGDGRNVTADEISKVNAANGGYVVMRNGEQINTSLQDFTGKPLIAVFSNGRKANIGEISRIYLGSVSNVPGFPQAASITSPDQLPETPDRMRRGRGNRDAYRDRSAAPANARTVVVPSNVEWTNTGFNVNRGQYLRFEPSGEIRLSTNGDDMARAAGALNARRADKATIPTIPVGALIGRIGNGEPFSIGDTTNAFDMPASGRLFLGVNDDHHPDNSGNYVVKVWEP